MENFLHCAGILMKWIIFHEICLKWIAVNFCFFEWFCEIYFTGPHSETLFQKVDQIYISLRGFGIFEKFLTIFDIPKFVQKLLNFAFLFFDKVDWFFYQKFFGKPNLFKSFFHSTNNFWTFQLLKIWPLSEGS